MEHNKRKKLHIAATTHLAVVSPEQCRDKPGNARANRNEVNLGEQNKDMSKARQKWDEKDTFVILTNCRQGSFFSRP